jgi:hypothetical protein
VNRKPATFTRDFDVFYAAARFVSQGRNPYALIGPGQLFPWRWPFFHPLPGALMIVPLAWLPLPTAWLAFVGITCLLFTYALGRVGGTRWRYVTIFSRPFEVTLLTGQMSFLFAAAYVLPVVAAFACVKPNIGAAIVAARADRRTIIWAVIGGSVLLALSFALQPLWVRDWLAAVHHDPFQRPAVLRSGGFLLLLAGLKWRRPEARLLLGLSLVPQTLGMYDALPLFFIPRRATEYVALTLLSRIVVLILADARYGSMDASIIASGDAVVHWMFLPALAMVLVRQNLTHPIIRP